ncbi:MAG: SGNH/GDSL hydrolase family protein [Oculatellaceae cyanobacterium bins.114]|nr:SGNH/GDSL hydrolase family protein [Oculatellaceae cyanobacterium bins.114]
MFTRHWVNLMGDRHSRLFVSLAKSRSKFPHLRVLPGWVFLSLTANGFLLALVMLSVLRIYSLSLTAPATASAAQPQPSFDPDLLITQLGPRHQLTYDQWVELLAQEARVVAVNQPPRLTVLAGDSLSLWFPSQLLPTERTWLNQGISGETSGGLLKRLEVFDQTRPETIFVMIGINDLIRGVEDEQILDNYQQIIRHLSAAHPRSQIVVQSILPHAAELATWEGRDRLLRVPNQRIRHLNQELAAIAHQEGAYFLNLYPLFANNQGNLRIDLSTDGLHLNPQGYLVWRTALELYSSMELSRE